MLRSTYLTYRILGPLLFSGLHRILSPPPDKVLLFLNTLVCLHPCTYAFTDIISLFFTFYFFFPFLPTNPTQWNCLIFCHSGCLPARRPDVIFGRGIPFLPPVIKRPDERLSIRASFLEFRSSGPGSVVPTPDGPRQKDRKRRMGSYLSPVFPPPKRTFGDGRGMGRRQSWKKWAGGLLDLSSH